MDLSVLKKNMFQDERIYSLRSDSSVNMFSTPVNILQNRLVDTNHEIGLFYLLNYQTLRFGDRLNTDYYSPEYTINKNNLIEYYDDLEGQIPLDMDDLPTTFFEIMSGRRTKRKFNQMPLSFSKLGTLLYLTQRMEKVGDYYRRNYSSGGGLYPLELIVVVNDVENLENGFYRYQPYSKSIKRIPHKEVNEFVKALDRQRKMQDLDNYSIAILFEMDYTKIFEKYGDLALSLGFIEVGILSNTIQMASHNLDIACCELGGFNKQHLEKTLEIDGINRHIVYAMILGNMIEED